VKKPVRLAAADAARGSTSSDRRKGHRAAAFAGALALLAAGGAAAAFLVGGEQTAASATDGPQMGLAAAAQQLPVKSVKTITIKTSQKPNTATAASPEPTTTQPKSSAAAPAVPVAPAAADAEALPPEDPRWARATEAPASQPIPVNPPVDLTPAAMGLALSALAAAEEPSDPMSTAAIYRNEERELRETPPAISPEPQMPVSEDKPAAEQGRAPQRTVRVNDGVNLRARGASGSRVLRTIPANASVGLIGCKNWCEVVYEGTRGFVYKSFIGGRRAPAERTSRAADQALPGVSIGATEKAAPAATTTAASAAAAAAKAQPKPTPPFLKKHENR
jgi:hypothetical protein